jgi:single-strand DNA-binding protein
MSGTLNKVMLIGHLGDSVKVTYFEGGNCIGRFPIATNETYTSKQTGEKVTNTEWHNVVVRNKAAEICEKYLNKGDRVYVEGRIKTRKWQGDDGKDRYTTEVHVDDFTFLTQRSADASDRPATLAQQPSVEQQSAPQPSQASEPSSDDDLPF